MNVKPFYPASQPRNASINKNKNSITSFGKVKYTPSAEEIKKMYKNGEDIFETISTIMQKLDKKYERMFIFNVKVNPKKEPRQITVHTELTYSGATKMLHRMAKNDPADEFHPNLVDSARKMLEGSIVGTKEGEYINKALWFLKTKAPVLQINYFPYGHNEQKAKFIKDFEEGLSLKNILNKLNYEYGGKKDFSPKRGLLERIFG